MNSFIENNTQNSQLGKMSMDIFMISMAFVVVKVCLMKYSGTDKQDEHQINLMSLGQGERYITSTESVEW